MALSLFSFMFVLRLFIFVHKTHVKLKLSSHSRILCTVSYSSPIFLGKGLNLSRNRQTGSKIYVQFQMNHKVTEVEFKLIRMNFQYIYF